MPIELRQMRGRASGVATFLVGILLAGSSGLAHRLAADDVGCLASGVAAHDASAHRIQAAKNGIQARQHCITCHWLRDLRPLAGSDRRLGPDGRCLGSPEGAGPGRYAGLLLPAVPARAPPA